MVIYLPPRGRRRVAPFLRLMRVFGRELRASGSNPTMLNSRLRTTIAFKPDFNIGMRTALRSGLVEEVPISEVRDLFPHTSANAKVYRLTDLGAKLIRRSPERYHYSEIEAAPVERPPERAETVSAERPSEGRGPEADFGREVAEIEAAATGEWSDLMRALRAGDRSASVHNATGASRIATDVALEFRRQQLPRATTIQELTQIGHRAITGTRNWQILSHPEAAEIARAKIERILRIRGRRK